MGMQIWKEKSKKLHQAIKFVKRSLKLLYLLARLLLVLGVLVANLHHNVIPVLWIDSVVRVDVVLECPAENPP